MEKTIHKSAVLFYTNEPREDEVVLVDPSHLHLKVRFSGPLMYPAVT